MNPPFDPYYEWLGIPPEAQPADYYRLLGIPLFEPNPNVISNAADQKMLFIRTFQNGSHSAESQMILNELAQARVTLLNAEAKEVYDTQLRTFLLSREMSSQAPPVPQNIDNVSEQISENPWAYIVDQQQYGPVCFADIVNLINERVILPTTPVCESGDTAYLAGEHPKLFSFFQMTDRTDCKEFLNYGEMSSQGQPVLQSPANYPCDSQGNSIPIGNDSSYQTVQNSQYIPLSDQELALLQSDEYSYHSQGYDGKPNIRGNFHDENINTTIPNSSMLPNVGGANPNNNYIQEEWQEKINQLKEQRDKERKKYLNDKGVDLNSNTFLLIAIVPFCIILLLVLLAVYSISEL